jgi:hypothetical protein
MRLRAGRRRRRLRPQRSEVRFFRAESPVNFTGAHVFLLMRDFPFGASRASP